MLYFLVVTLTAGTLVISIGAHEITHIKQLTTGSEIKQACFFGYAPGMNGKMIANGWVTHKQSEMPYIALTETIPNIVGITVLIICFVINSFIFFIFVDFIKGGTSNGKQ